MARQSHRPFIHHGLLLSSLALLPWTCAKCNAMCRAMLERRANACAPAARVGWRGLLNGFVPEDGHLLAEVSGQKSIALSKADGSHAVTSTHDSKYISEFGPAQALLPSALSSTMARSTHHAALFVHSVFTNTTSSILGTAGSNDSLSEISVLHAETLAVSVQWGDHRLVWSTLKLPPSYGHIWHLMYAFWWSVIRPLLAQTRPPAGERIGSIPREGTSHAADRNVTTMASYPTIVLPGGSHLGTATFHEIEALWSSDATGVRIMRAPWVPICMDSPGFRSCCVRADTPPPGLPFHLLAGFPGEPPDFAQWPRFRSDAWRALGVDRVTLETSPPRLMWVLASSGSSLRRIDGEASLLQSARELLRQKRPGWHFTVLDLRHEARRGYRYELQQWAHASLVVSLFGSSEHNCRFMANGTALIEIHGALRGDGGSAADYFYRDVCARRLGVRWLPYEEPGFRAGYSVAHVNQTRFLVFLERVLLGEEETLLAEYAAQLSG